MKEGGVRYGFLSNFNKTVFLKQDYNTGPTLRQCFWYLPVEPTNSRLPHQQHPFNDTVGEVDTINTVVNHIEYMDQHLFSLAS